MANLVTRARNDLKRIVEGEFSTEITLTAPGGETATVQGRYTDHHINVDTDGRAINSKNAYVGIVEQSVLDSNANYPTRNNSGEVSFIEHIVSFEGIDGTTKKFKVKQNFPDNYLGYEALMLGSYNG